MTKYALRFHQLGRLREQAAHTRHIKAGGIDVALAPFIVPAQRRGGRS